MVLSRCLIGSRWNALFDIDAGKAKTAAKAIGPNARGEALDVRDPGAVDAAMRQVVKTEGRMDILVASAAILFVTPVLEIEPDDWNRVIGTNLTGLFYCSQRAALFPVSDEAR